MGHIEKAVRGSTGYPSGDGGARPWQPLLISEVAEEYGFSFRALRFYEEKGLISPHRAGNQRVYHLRDLRRLEIIAQGKRIGLALVEIREILGAGGGGESMSRRQLEIVLEKVKSRVEEIKDEQQILAENLREARDLIKRLSVQLAETNEARVREELV